MVIATGSTVPREMPGTVPGANLKGIHPAMDFLVQQTRRLLNKPLEEEDILATGKNVIVIGGGDTGSDCVGTSLRQGCKSLINLELMPKPPIERSPDNPWPQWPMVFRTSSSHQEGGERRYSLLTKSFEDDGNGNVAALNTVHIEWGASDATGRRAMSEIEGTEERIPCELVLLALGFVRPDTDTYVKDLGLELENNPFGQAIKAGADFKTSRDKYFAAGDARRGQSLVVWAIYEGREAARAVDVYLMGSSDLHARDSHGYNAMAASAAS